MNGEYDLLEYALKWLVPFVCAGLFTLLIVPLWNRYKVGKHAELQKEWNECATGMKQDIETFKEESKKKDSQLEKKIDLVQTTLLTKIEENTAGIRQAILQSHLRELIIDGKMYLKQGYIGLEQLADYNERFLVYKSLGGNGHVDPWIKKIRELPNNPPELE
jgi:hypothetical protein